MGLTVVPFCCCGHSPCDGLDCGVYLPGRAPRKQPSRKSPSEAADIRAKAWTTRREKYGKAGHK